MLKYIVGLLFLCSTVYAGPGPAVIWGPGPTAKALAPLASPNGTVSLPGITLSSDTATGFYYLGSGDLGMTVGGTLGMEARLVSGNVNFGFGTTASAAATNPVGFSSSYNGVQYFQYGNASTGASSTTAFQILNGTPNAAVSLGMENHAYQASGYLAAADVIYAGANVGANFILSNDYSSGNIIFSTGGHTASTTERVKIDQYGHMNHHSTGTAPTVTANCGSSPTVTGNDTVGVLNVGTGGSATTCTLTFNQTYTTTPHCFVNDQSANIALKAVPTATTLVITAAAAFAASSLIDYYCVNHY